MTLTTVGFLLVISHVKLLIYAEISYFLSLCMQPERPDATEIKFNFNLRGCLPKILIPILDHITDFLETLHVSYTL